MKLRGRLILAVSITTLALIFVNLGGIQTVLWHSLRQTLREMESGFEKIEDDQLEKDLRRVQSATEELLLQAENRLTDWAQWDDAWNFMRSQDPQFIKSNLSQEVLAGTDYDWVLFFDTTKHLVASEHAEKDTITAKRQLVVLTGLIQENQILLPFSEEEVVRSGFLQMSNGPGIFAARPITQTSGAGPVRGTLLFVRLLTPKRVEELADRVHLRLMLTPIAARNDQPNTYPKLDRSRLDTIQAHLLIRDYKRKPAYEFHVFIPRNVKHQAVETKGNIVSISSKMTIVNAIGALLGGIFTVFVLVIVLNRFLLGKVRVLESHMEIIRRESSHDHRVPDLGRDEIGGFAHQFNAMLNSLQSVQRSLHQQNLVRKALLDALPMPVMPLDAQFHIAGELSQKAKEYFGVDASGQLWADILLLNEKERLELEDFLDVFAQGLLPVAEMVALNPIRQVHLQSPKSSWLRLSYFPLPHSNPPAPGELILLVLAEDMSQEIQHQDELKSLSADNSWLKAILADPDLFVEFFRESRQSIDVANQVLSSKIGEADIAHAFRHIHTLQGCASGFGLMSLSEAAVRLEEQLSIILNTLSNEDQSIRFEAEEQARRELEVLLAVLEKEQKRLLGALNIQSTDWKAGPSLRIPLHKLTEWSALLSAGAIAEVSQGISQQLRIPLSRMLSRTMLWFPGMVNRTSKQAEIHLIGGDVLVPVEWTTSLNDILVHLLRNAMAHGIEYPEERSLRGKPDVGSIRIKCQQQLNLLILSVEDDGGGFDMQVENAFGLGNTSKKQADDLSGRGVGLHAVKTMVEEIGGTIAVVSQPGRGANFVIRFDLNPLF